MVTTPELLSDDLPTFRGRAGVEFFTLVDGTANLGATLFLLSQELLGITQVKSKAYVNIGSGNGLVPSGNKPLPEPMLTQISVSIWRH